MMRSVFNCMLCAVIMLLLASCGREPPEQRLRDTFAAMQESVEAGKPGGFMDGVAADFVGNQGLDRAGMERLMRQALAENAFLELLYATDATGRLRRLAARLSLPRASVAASSGDFASLAAR